MEILAEQMSLEIGSPRGGPAKHLKITRQISHFASARTYTVHLLQKIVF